MMVKPTFNVATSSRTLYIVHNNSIILFENSIILPWNLAPYRNVYPISSFLRVSNAWKIFHKLCKPKTVLRLTERMYEHTSHKLFIETPPLPDRIFNIKDDTISQNAHLKYDIGSYMCYSAYTLCISFVSQNLFFFLNNNIIQSSLL